MGNRKYCPGYTEIRENLHDSVSANFIVRFQFCQWVFTWFGMNSLQSIKEHHLSKSGYSDRENIVL